MTEYYVSQTGGAVTRDSTSRATAWAVADLSAAVWNSIRGDTNILHVDGLRRENVPYLHEVMRAAFLCDPPDVLIHWLRRSELRELSLPFCLVAMWWGLKQAGEYPAWSYWLRGRGTVLYGPVEVPGGDWVAQCRDPYGAIFAVHCLAADMKAAQAAAAAPAQSAAAPAAPAQAPSATRAPARKAAKKPAKKAAAKPAKKKAVRKAAAKPAARKAGAKKKVAPKKKPAARKPAGRKAARRSAARGKAAVKTKRAGGKKRTAKKPRKGK